MLLCPSFCLCSDSAPPPPETIDELQYGIDMADIPEDAPYIDVNDVACQLCDAKFEEFQLLCPPLCLADNPATLGDQYVYALSVYTQLLYEQHG